MKYPLDTLKVMLLENKDFLKKTRGYAKYFKTQRRVAKENIEKLELAIWKIENPESFENNRLALQGFVDSCCYGEL